MWGEKKKHRKTPCKAQCTSKIELQLVIIMHLQENTAEDTVHTAPWLFQISRKGCKGKRDRALAAAFIRPIGTSSCQGSRRTLVYTTQTCFH